MSVYFMVLKRVGFSILTLLASASFASAQTSGTLDTQTSDLWSTAPWMITSGGGPYPGAGGVATFLAQTNTIVGLSPDLTSVFPDVPVTLSGINFGGPFRWQIAAAGGGSLTLSSTGAIVDAELPDFGQRYVIAKPMGGGGSAGLTKTGNGSVTLSASNTYTGGTHVNGGTLEIATNDAALGAGGAGNGVSMDGGGNLRVSGALFTTSRALNIGTGGGSVESLVNSAYNGVVDGSGDLFITGNAAATSFTANNTLTGTVTLATQVMFLNLMGANGAFRSAEAFNFFGGLVNLDNSSANNNNRLSDTATISSGNRVLIVLSGNSAAPTTETAGALNLAGGTTRITSIAGAGQQTSFNFASINRQNNATLFLAGTNLGATPGADVAQITSVTSPGPLIGGGGAAGSTNISVLPWMTGKDTTSGGFDGMRHVTYDPVTDRFRTLMLSEYAAFGGGPTNNVRLTGSTAAPVNTTVNALAFAPPSPATLSGGPINVTSGSFLHSPTSFFFPDFSTVSAGLSFGTAEGIIHATSNLEISGAITGSGGLTISPHGFTVLLSGANSYTGPTHLLEGAVKVDRTLSTTPFGDSDVAHLHPGAAIIGDLDSQSPKLPIPDVLIVIYPDLEIYGRSNEARRIILEKLDRLEAEIRLRREATLKLIGGIIQEQVAEINGNIITESNRIEGALPAYPATIQIGADSYVALNGDNAQEATEIQGHLIVGNNSACGLGPITFTQAGASIEGSGTTPRTLPNPVEMQGTATFAGNAPLIFTGNINLNGKRNISVTNTQPTTLSGNVSSGSLTKQGSGTLVLNRPNGNNYTGGTTVSAGTLLVNNSSGSGTGHGINLVDIGGALRGNFALAGETFIDGMLAPGNSVGTANFGSNLTLTFADQVAQTVLELASASSADHINVAGLLTLDGTVIVQTIGGYIAQLGDSFDLLDWGTLDASNFDPKTDLDLSGAAVAGGRMWDTSNFLIDGTISVVPGTPTAIQLVSAVSRKSHGGAGSFDIPLPLSGNPGIECRSGGGSHTIVYTFNNNVVSGNASVTTGVGVVSGSPVFSGQTMTVNLTGVANVQTLTVKLSNVMDEFSQVLADTFVSVGMLIGDTNGNRIVNASDISQTKAQLGQPLAGGNFRTDSNTNGAINATDVALVKSHSGEGLGPFVE